MTWLNDWFQNPKYTPMAQVIFAFVFGILLGPWGSGLFFLVVFTIFYEIAYYLFINPDIVVPFADLSGRNYNPKVYIIFLRVGIMLSSILGFIVGRTLSEDEILYEGVPF